MPGQIALHSAAISITLEIMFLTTSFFIYFYFWLRWVFVAAHGLTLVAASGGLLFVAVHWLLIAVASLVADHRL